MRLVSAAFTEGGQIPRKYTCEGEDLSPPLQLQEVPPQARSLALIMDDPDVPPSIRPDRMWVHWIIYNLSPTITHLEEGRPPKGIQGQNTGGQNRYMGPCPPDREHRYFFKLYALDCELKLAAGATKAELLRAMGGHILAEAQLMGRYVKVGKS